MVTMSAIRIASALNSVSHLLLLLRVDAVPVRELQTSLTLPHLLNADHVVSVACYEIVLHHFSSSPSVNIDLCRLVACDGLVSHALYCGELPFL